MTCFRLKDGTPLHKYVDAKEYSRCIDLIERTGCSVEEALAAKPRPTYRRFVKGMTIPEFCKKHRVKSSAVRYVLSAYGEDEVLRRLANGKIQRFFEI